MAVDSAAMSGVQDVLEGLARWRLWAYLGLQDIRARYRRSALGPLWLALGLGVTVLGIGLLYSSILKTEPGEYVPFLAIGLLIWGLISTSINEGTMLFYGAGHVIQTVRVPYTTFVLRTLVRNLIVAAHAVVVVVIAFVYYRHSFNPLVALAAIPGVLLLTINLYWITLLVAITSTRFRDVGQMILYGLQLVLFVTPIIWMPSQASRQPLLLWNPVRYLIDIVRVPVFDGVVPWSSFAVCAVMAVVGLAVTLAVFARTRRHLVYWI